ncbi:UNVERIFIED_ORG: hypothetical protein QOE_4081 [Clostridioides difficile F501]
MDKNTILSVLSMRASGRRAYSTWAYRRSLLHSAPHQGEKTLNGGGFCP